MTSPQSRQIVDAVFTALATITGWVQAMRTIQVLSLPAYSDGLKAAAEAVDKLLDIKPDEFGWFGRFPGESDETLRATIAENDRRLAEDPLSSDERSEITMANNTMALELLHREMLAHKAVLDSVQKLTIPNEPAEPKPE